MIRLFAALELPDDTRMALASWGARAVGRSEVVRLVPAESLHITLVFLGSQEESDAGAIAEAVVGAARPLGETSVTGAAWLPPRRPGVLVADLADGPAFSALHANVVEVLRPWHEPESRPYRPHVTVARVRGHQRMAPLDVPAPPPLEFSPSALVLCRSLLEPGGARYETVARAPLG